MTLKSRVLEYCEVKGLSIAAFERVAGLSNGFFKESSRSPRANKRKQISEAFPDLNIDWLLTGEGNMLKEESVSTNSENTNQQSDDMTVQELLEAIKRRDRQMDEMLSQQGRLIDVIEALSGTSIKQSDVG